MTVIELHGRLANTVLFYIIIMAVWGLWRYFRKQGVGGSYWGALVIAEVLLVLQTLLGTYLWISGAGQLAGWIHILYVVVAILIIPAVFFFTRGEEQRRAMLIYGAALLFGMGIILRAMATG